MKAREENVGEDPSVNVGKDQHSSEKMSPLVGSEDVGEVAMKLSEFD